MLRDEPVEKMVMYSDTANKLLYIRNGLKMYFDNKQAAIDTAREVFIQNAYAFNTPRKAPTIIDIGANIGLSVLYFKEVYPESTIVAIEPNPVAYNCLVKNIELNHLKNIITHKTAATGSSQSGPIKLYGECRKDGYALGNSIIGDWGLQRKSSSFVKVQPIKVSKLIHSNVDLLKLDIEGAEQAVLMEIGEKLRYVDQIFMEVHESVKLVGINELSAIKCLLESYNFKVDIHQKDLKNVFPKETQEWRKLNDPKLYVLHAKNNSLCCWDHS